MTDKVKLAATVRQASGKGAARRIRREGLVPGVVYSAGDQAMTIAVQPLALTRALTGPWRRNALIELELDGGNKTVMLKDIQKHPLRRSVVHIDFLELDENKPVKIKIPFEITGKSAAVKAGGRIHTPRRYLNVRCLPTAIPATIQLDSTTLDWGAHRASAITLPEGAELLDDAQLTVLTISRPRGVVADEEVAPAEGAPAADAPAAG